MDIAEFKKTLETIKKEWSNEAHSYIDENYFIYIKGNMKSSYVEKTLGTKMLMNIRYIIPVGAYSYSYKNNKDISLNAIGFFNNKYEPCEIIFDDWELYKLDFSHNYFNGKTYYYPIPHIRNINNPTCKKVFGSGYAIEDFDEILNEIWEYIQENKK
ncbi:hypothetical protein [Bacteroides cellulosilyticus]|jgi:hypothetical protein|uniref:hypothetical protein n=1 Tax=Bacteroides cellulosilyticus TaxID=246787 RepID=UPI000E4AC4E9|nr:hypothetical protein [Bacteroides cellulosilyticus]RGU27888.1 hypothetical protein DWW88_08265 [Bacteroides cellulosilyticus]